MAGKGSVTPDLHTQNSPSKKLLNRREKKQQRRKKERESAGKGREWQAAEATTMRARAGHLTQRGDTYQTAEPSNQPWVTQKEALT